MNFSSAGARAPAPAGRGASAHVQSALLAAIAEPLSAGARGGDGGALWVSDGLPPALQVSAALERVELAAIDTDRSLGVPADHLGLSVCVLDGVLETAVEPADLLAWAYRRLRPGGRLVLHLRHDRASGVGRHRSRMGSGPDTAPPFPGETLQGLLFREGFEEPRLRRCDGALVVSARRSALPPPVERLQRLSVIMAVYNEASTFEKTMSLVLAKTIPGMEIDVIVVESNSTDGTRTQVLQHSDHPRVRVILEERPRGKGHAVRAGLEAARGDFVLIQDADMEYDIDDYEVLLEPLRSGEVGFVLGMRTSPDGSWGLRDFGQRDMRSHFMNLGHEVFLTLFNVVYGQRLRDPFTMYKVIRRDCLYGLTFESNRFDFDWELTGKLVRAGYHPREIPVGYRSRSFGQGKKIAFFRDPLTWVRACFKFRFVRLYRES